jgi:hypothetical protein
VRQHKRWRGEVEEYLNTMGIGNRQEIVRDLHKKEEDCMRGQKSTAHCSAEGGRVEREWKKNKKKEEEKKRSRRRRRRRRSRRRRRRRRSRRRRRR